MGVHGLWKLLEAAGKPVTLESLEGKVLAVDISIWLNQMVKGMRDHHGNTVPNAHLLGLFTRVCKLLYYRIKPVFVFDGGVPQLKKQTLSARRLKKDEATIKSNRAARKLLQNFLKHRALGTALGGRSSTGANLGQPSSHSSREAGRHQEDIFLLAPMPENPLGDAEAEQNEAWEERMAQRDFIYTDLENPEEMDINSQEFKELPPEIQHEILTDLKESRKHNSWAKVDSLPAESDDFSSFQLNKLVKQSKLSQQIVDVRNEMNLRGSGDVVQSLTGPRGSADILSQRVVSEDSSHFIYIKGLSGQRKDGDVQRALLAATDVGDEDDDGLDSFVMLENNHARSSRMPGTLDGTPEIIMLDTSSDEESVDPTNPLELGTRLRDLEEGGSEAVVILSSDEETMKKSDDCNSSKHDPDVPTAHNEDKSEETWMLPKTDMTSVLDRNTIDDTVKSDQERPMVVGNMEEAGEKSEIGNSTNVEEGGERWIKTPVDYCSEGGFVRDEETGDDAQVKNRMYTSVDMVEMAEILDKSAAEDCDTGVKAVEKSVRLENNSPSTLGEMDSNSSVKTKGIGFESRDALESSKAKDGIAFESRDALESSKAKDGIGFESRHALESSKAKDGIAFESPAEDLLKTGATECPPSAETGDGMPGILRKDGNIKRSVDDVEGVSSWKRPRLNERIDSDQANTDSDISVNIENAQLEVEKTEQTSGVCNGNIVRDNSKEDMNVDKTDKEVQDEGKQGVDEAEDSSEETFLEVKIDPAKARADDELFPASIFEPITILSDEAREEEEQEEVEVEQHHLQRDMVAGRTEVSAPASQERNGSVAEVHQTLPADDDDEEPETIEIDDDGEDDFIASAGEPGYVEEEEEEEEEDEEEDAINIPDDESAPLLRDIHMENEFEGMSQTELVELQEVLELESAQLQREQKKQERIGATITDQMYNEAQDLLRFFGVPYLVSPTEAEAQCAFLDLTNQTHGTITNDSDIWLFGGCRVYKNFFDQAKHVEVYQADDIRKQFMLDRERMISLALMCGSDYTEGIAGVGPVTAMEVLSEFSGEGLEVLVQFKQWWDAAQNQVKVPQETKVKSKLRHLNIKKGFPSIVVVNAYLQPTVDDSEEGFFWLRPDLDLLRKYANEKFGWSKAKADESLLPVMKQLSVTENQKHITSYFPSEANEQKKMKSKRLKTVVNRMKAPPSEGDGKDDNSQGTHSPATPNGLSQTGNLPVTPKGKLSSRCRMAKNCAKKGKQKSKMAASAQGGFIQSSAANAAPQEEVDLSESSSQSSVDSDEMMRNLDLDAIVSQASQESEEGMAKNTDQEKARRSELGLAANGKNSPKIANTRKTSKKCKSDAKVPRAGKGFQRQANGRATGKSATLADLSESDSSS